MSDLASRLSKLSPAKRQLLEKRLQERGRASDRKPVAEPIAIVGMGCRFPGVRSPQAFWEVISEGQSRVDIVPPSRWDAEAFYDPEGETPGKMSTKWGAFVEDVDQFDPMFFGISPREASRMDPQQRLLLEVAWQTLEDASTPPATLAGSRTGVYVGIGGTDYSKIPSHFENYLQHIDAHVGTGNALSIAANRISYIFDFRGPSFAVDTACSSALVALHCAVQALQNRECDAALAGGVNLILSPEVTIAFSKARMLSPDGVCRPFDSRANGYVRGEGCGLILIKRLSDAKRDGDNVLAVIRGTAINQDGKTSGITAPNGQSQQQVIRAALKRAGLSTEQISYVEAHGTGTPLGDPIETQSLAALFPRKSQAQPPCLITSVKANIGHTETVSGIAGLIKAVLSMQHETIAPQLHLQELNPNLRLDDSRIEIPRQPVPWPKGEKPRFAGISSFGFGGTNAHIILQDPDSRRPSSTELMTVPTLSNGTDRPQPLGETDRQDESIQANAATTSKRKPFLLTVSARDDDALSQLAGQYAEALQATAREDQEFASVEDFCAVASSGRNHFSHRAAVLGNDRAELEATLRQLSEGQSSPLIIRGVASASKRPKVAFLFTGQGSQYTSMGSKLYESEPVFRETLDQCDQVLSDQLDDSLLDVMFGRSRQEDLINETRYTQPALFAIEFALARLWQSWGIEPDVVLGHSVGEYVAAAIAGIFSWQDGLNLIAHRGRLMQQLPPGGKMAVVFAPADRVRSAIETVSDRVSIAAINGPENTVISGEGAAVDRLVSEFKRQTIQSKELTVSHAFHSPLMDPILDDFRRFAQQVDYSRPRIKLISNRTADTVQSGQMDADYWTEHIRDSVRFFDAMQAMVQQGVDLAVEAGPSPHLTGMARRFVEVPHLHWSPSLRQGQDEVESMTRGLANLYAHGANVDWVRYHGGRRPRGRIVPGYPFQRQRLWFEPDTAKRDFSGGHGPTLHPLLGSAVPNVLGKSLYEAGLSASRPNYLQDHTIQGSEVVPAAAFLEISLAAAHQQFGPGCHTVENLSVQQALFVTRESVRRVQTTVTKPQYGTSTVECYSATESDGGEEEAWTMHVRASIRAASDDPQQADTLVENSFQEEMKRTRSEFVDRKTSEEFYALLGKREMSYGPAFRVVESTWRMPDRASCALKIPAEIKRQLADYSVHPAILDGCLQASALVIPLEEDGSYSPYTYMPTAVGAFQVVADIKSFWEDSPEEMELGVYARRIDASSTGASPETVTADLVLVDGEGRALASLTDVKLRRVGRGSEPGQEDPSQWLYRIQWQEAPLPVEPPVSPEQAGAASSTASWLIVADHQMSTDSLCSSLSSCGDRTEVISFDEVVTGQTHAIRNFVRSLESPTDLKGVIFLGSTRLGGGPFKNDPKRAAHDLCHVLTKSLQTLVKEQLAGVKTWIVTTGVQAIDEQTEIEGLFQSPLWGLGRVAAMEHPELGVRLIDVDAAAADGGESASSQLPIRDPMASRLVGEFRAADSETQIAYRGTTRYVARLTRAPDLIDSATAMDDGPLVVPTATASHLTLRQAGSVDGLHIESMQRTRPTRDQVEIEVRATGLNFSDVLKSLGLYPGIKDEVVPMGIECSGVVVAVGPEVDAFQVGDEVMGVVPYGFATNALSSQYALVKKPAGLSHDEAAAVPIAFLTAHYALRHLGELEADQRVLIHAGAGGVGLAAIQVAKHVGAEIFSTAGSDRKRSFLKSLGVDHVFNSRTLEFADQILDITHREGVDVVLNSLPGDAIDRSLSVLGAYGRFLEIGKTDIYQNRMVGLAPFQDNLSYFAIDLDRILRQRPRKIEQLFREVVTAFDQGYYQPPPITSFSYAETRDAFRFMAQRRNIGKIVVTIDQPRQRDPEVAPENGAQDESTASLKGTWLITGGLGALGRRVTQSLIERGATHLALLSRRTPDEDTLQWMRQWQSAGATVINLQGDVADADSLGAALGQLPDSFPPIGGVIHAAGVLDDGVLYEMTPAQLRKAMLPKIDGAWNLHQATLDHPVKHFLLFSSIASVLGSPGQANYAAGNAFLDSLASYRSGLGLPATTIDWGPWADAGMAADQDRQTQLAGRGMELLPADAAIDLMHELLSEDGSPAVVMRARWNEMAAGYRGEVPSLLQNLLIRRDSDDEADQEAGVDHAFRRELAAADETSRQERLREYFTDQLAVIMGIRHSEIDPSEPLNTLGLDSLMAIELKNQVETRLGVVLPMARFMEGPTVTTLAETVAQLVAEGQEATPLVRSDQAEDQRSDLSFGQQALWFLYQLAPQSAAYHICDAVYVHGRLDLDVLQRSTQAIVDRHAAFRTTFHHEEGHPYQQIHDEWPIEIKSIDASDWDQERLRKDVARELHVPFDLEQDVLLRVTVYRRSDDLHVLLFCVHHIVADFWSLVACTQEFMQLYSALSHNQDPELAGLSHDYGSFVRWQKEMLQSDEGEQHWQYWREQLSGELPVLSLPTDRPRPPLQSFRGRLAFQWLDPKLTSKLKQFAEDRGTTLNTLLLAAYQTLLHRYSGQDDIIVGLPTSGRSRAEFAPLVGYFVNPVPVRTDLSGNPTFAQLLDQVREHSLGALEHQDFPFSLLVDRLQPQRDPRRSTMFQAAFVMQKAQVMHDQGLTPFLMGQSGAKLEVADLTFESMTLDHWVAQLDLSLAASEAEGGTSLGLQYNTDLFDDSTAERILQHYQRMLEHIAEEPTATVASLRLLSDEQKETFRSWNETAAESDPRCVHERVADQASRTPDAVAVQCGDRQLTYRQLDQQANQLARLLREEGVDVGDRVGLCLDRDIELIVAIQGILRSGAAYVPLDPQYPASRLAQIASSAGMKRIVSRQHHLDALRQFDGETICLDSHASRLSSQSSAALPSYATPDDLIYVIYTSGSTGTPKGAGVYHRGFANLMDWYVDDLRLTADDSTLVITSHGFDLTQKNLYSALTIGGTLHLSQTTLFDPALIIDEIESNQIRLLNCTPSHLYGLVESDRDRLGRLASLRKVVLGGEPIELGRFEAWMREESFDAEIINSYGPTECTDVVIAHRIKDPLSQLGRSIPLGRPIRNVRTLILDRNQGLVPPGSVGELCLAGTCLGAGYINDAELTADRFVTVLNEGGQSERVYRTGDLCRYRSDGVLEFLGRADHQIKLRGFRIELGEIESHLADHPDVREAVVLVRQDSGEVKQLVGYVVLENANRPTADLREFLRGQLPAHMVPSAIVVLDHIPLTPHGKLDRKSLPAPSSELIATMRYAEPKGDREHLLAEIWSELLSQPKVGRDDNFFELGGDSLLTIELGSRLASRGWSCSPAQVFQNQTLRELAAALVEKSDLATEDEETAEAAALLPIQRWFFDLDLKQPAYFNQSVAIDLPPGLHTECLDQALCAVRRHHPALRTKFTWSEHDYVQQPFSVSSSTLLRSVDLAQLDDDQASAMIADYCRRADTEIDPASGEVFRALHFDLGGNRPSRLWLSAHHLAIDPYSWRILLEDLLTAYQQSLGSQRIQLPRSGVSPNRFASLLSAQLGQLDRSLELDRWARIAADPEASLLVDDPDGENLVSTAKKLRRQLTMAESELFRQQSAVAVDQSIAMLTAAFGAAHRHAAGRPVRIDIERLGRDGIVEDVDLSRSVGWFVVMHPLLSGVAGRGGALAESKYLGEQLRSLPRKGATYGMMRYLADTATQQQMSSIHPASQVRLNYLGQVEKAGGSGLPFQVVQDETGNRQAEEDRRPHLLEIDARLRDDRLLIEWTYSSQCHRTETIEQLADAFVDQLKEILSAG